MAVSVTVGEYFYDNFGRQIYYISTHPDREDLGKVSLSTVCGGHCRAQIDRYKAFMRECPDQINDVLTPILASLVAQLEVCYFG